jgi:hypothetical protein
MTNLSHVLTTKMTNNVARAILSRENRVVFTCDMVQNTTEYLSWLRQNLKTGRKHVTSLAQLKW